MFSETQMDLISRLVRTSSVKLVSSHQRSWLMELVSGVEKLRS